MKTNLIIILFIIGNVLFSTEQIKDKLYMLDGSEFDIYHKYLLSDFFIENPELHPESEIISSNLWRGYIAYFYIDDDGLYLFDIKIQTDNYPKEISVFNKVFPYLDRVLVSWFSGFIAMPERDRVREFKFEKGILVEDTLKDHYHDILILKN